MHLDTLAPEPVKPLSAETSRGGDEDRELALRLARGERLAFEEVVERYGSRVTGLAARLLGWRDGAEDVTQEVFLAVLRNQSRFRGQSSLWTWLATITVNRCRSRRRKRWLFDKFASAAVWRVNASSAASGDQLVLREETGASVRRIVAKLPAMYREVIVLRYLQELSPAEIAEILGVRLNTVEVRLARARRLLVPRLSGLRTD